MKDNLAEALETMKAHPIIFGTESVKAILEGRKTQTRRVIKPQPINADYWTFHQDTPFNGAFYPNTDNALPKLLKCPYGQVGDRLWVKETWVTNPIFPLTKLRGKEDLPYIIYKADKTQWNDYKWRSSLFMPRWASRITLEITGLRVERLQEITEEDCLAEGIPERGTIFMHPTARGIPLIHAYANLWDSLNAKRGYGWETNPWVWVIEFKILQ